MSKTTLRTGGWTAASRKKLTGIRSPHKSDPKQFTLSRDEAWSALVKIGVASGDPPTDLDPEAELSRWTQAEQHMPYPQKHHTCPGKAVVGFWVASGGLTAPLDLFFPKPDDASHNYLSVSTSGKGGYFIAALRRHMFAAPMQEYLAAKAAFKGRYLQLCAATHYEDVQRRDLIAVLFSRDQEWVNALLEKQFAAETTIMNRHPILAAITDPALALRYAQSWKMCHYEMGPWAHDLVESLDGSAVPVLEVLMAITRSARDRKPMQAALKVAQQLPLAGASAPADEPAKSEGAQLDLPASLTAPFKVSEAAKKMKRPKKVPAPTEIVTVTLPDELRASVQGAYDAIEWPDQATVQQGVESYSVKVCQPQSQHEYYYLWRRLLKLKTPALVKWLEDFDKTVLAKMLRDRNAPSPDEVLRHIVLPLEGREHETVSRVIVGLKPKVFVRFAEWAHSPTIVERMSVIAAGKKSAKEAMAWLLARPELALAVLVPAAVNASGKALAAYLTTLSRLAEDHGQRLQQAIAALPKDAGTYLSNKLGTSKAVVRPTTLPAVWRSTALPEVMHADSGQALPGAVMQEVGAMMLTSPSSAPMPGMLALRELATADSCRALGQFLYEHWVKSGYIAADRWQLDYYGFLAGDEITASLTGDLLTWAGKGQHRRAFWAVDVIAGMGTDRAARALWDIQRDNRYDGLTTRAGQGLAKIAELRGMTADELHDEMVPTLGLTLGQRFTYDFGPRQFEGQITPQLRVRIRNEDGSWRENLPNPRKSDDASKSRSAKNELSKLNLQLQKVRTQQPRRLERAMVDQRRWTKARFEKVLLAHPLMAYVAQGVIWGQYDEAGALLGTFRIDEQLKLEDADDEAVAIAVDATVGAVHPAELSEASRRAWGALLGDYKIIQPFPQLQREVVNAADADTELMAVEGRVAKPGRVLGLRRRGWTKGSTEDAGIIHTMRRTALSKGHRPIEVSIRFEPGLSVGYYQDAGEQTLQGFRGDHESLNAIAISEIASDMRWMFSSD